MSATASNLNVVAPVVGGRPITVVESPLPAYRLNILRAGYLFTAIGLALTRWPVLASGEAASLPVFEGVVVAMLSAMSLLAFLGVRYPLRLLPILLFESLWKIAWVVAVAIPNLVQGDMSDEMRSVLVNVSLVMFIIAITPWDYAWERFVRSPGEPWRSRS